MVSGVRGQRADIDPDRKRNKQSEDRHSSIELANKEHKVLTLGSFNTEAFSAFLGMDEMIHLQVMNMTDSGGTDVVMNTVDAFSSRSPTQMVHYK